MDNGFEPKDDQSERLVDILDGQAVISHIVELPEMYKKIMHMRFVQSMSIRDISIITNQTNNSTAVQIHRGLQKLKVLCGSKHSLIN